MTSRKEALSLIEDAFRDAPRPPNDQLLHPESADATDLEPLYDIRQWQDMSDAEVIGTYAAPSFMSAAAFRHFLPAYMGYALRNPDSPEACVSGIIWHLDPSLYDGRIAAYTRSKFALLDETQRQAVIAFLEAMTSTSYGDDARRALAEWLGRDREPRRGDGSAT